MDSEQTIQSEAQGPGALDRLLAHGLVPDFLIRSGIRRLNRVRLKEEFAANHELSQKRQQDLIARIRKSPLAVSTREANEQHYEVPPEFFELVLGKHLKYSSAYWGEGDRTLEDAEERMLKLTCQRAQLEGAKSILELGCGWGSLTLYMAEHFPSAQITAVSNSQPQRLFIEERARQRGLKNITIITSDMNSFEPSGTFDRIVSVEMFEHMRNYEILFDRLSKWLNLGGKLFVHIFTHKHISYLFEPRDSSDWMSRYFFTGGIMPSNHLLLYFAQGFTISDHWVVNGTHYQKTSEAWLKNMDNNLHRIRKLFDETYGAESRKMIEYWRIFFMAVAELFGTKKGEEWMVNHYLFEKNGNRGS